MKLLALVFAISLAGCGQNVKQPFFKPEISGATYAAPKRVPFTPIIVCNGSTNPCIDDGTWTGWGFVDDDSHNAAPKFHVIPAR